MKILLSPTLEAIERLHVIGLDFVNSEGLKKSIRLKLLFGVFDFVAKAKVFNMVQFNGAYGCPTCVHPGVHRNNRHLYLLCSTYPLRTLQSIEAAQNKSNETGAIVDGIKGKSVLHGYLNLVNDVPPDYMHCVLEGVTKSLLMFWTNSKYRREPFSIRQHLYEVDNALQAQTPPTEFTRSPRSLIKDLSYWKASEF
uniref:Uncharacterized protein n=1 Tax=Amphimedon queenslandica TaxID=400682 RepID=A0A1X7UPB3_AMPQE